MLTDLPSHWIVEVDKMLAEQGFRASVLSDVDDPNSALGQALYGNARFVIDGMIARMKLDAKIYACIIVDDGRDFQACAINLDDDEYCIAIWIDVAFRTAAMTSRLLATVSGGGIFSLDPSIAVPAPNSSGHNTFEAFKSLSYLPPVEFEDPVGEFRRRLDFGAFEWLVLHELGHIVNGHLANGSTLNGLTYILEDDPSTSRDDNLTRLALEVDADCFANLFAMQSAMRRPLPMERSDATASELVEHRAKAYVFALMTIIRGFDDAPFDVETLFDSDHPPGGLRMAYLTTHIAAMMVEERISCHGVDVARLAAEVVEAVEIAIDQATGIQGHGGNFVHAYRIGWDPFHVPVLSRWARLYDGLNKVKLNPYRLAPPQYPPA